MTNQMAMERRPFSVYLMLQFCSSFILAMTFAVSSLYYVTLAHLNPLQLVLVGTSLELAVFLFEIPTGILADVKSRRLSVIIGYFLIGVGFVLEGALPLFWTIVLAQILWGMGYTFTSGATQAWIVDEIGEERAGEAFVQGAQTGQLGGFLGVPIGILLGLIRVNIPVLVGGGMMILLAVLLIVTMKETGFKPTPSSERNTWHTMARTVRDASRLIRRQRVLLLLLGIIFFYGLYSEGFDRLWTAHLLEDFTILSSTTSGAVIYFGLINMIARAFGYIATGIVKRSVDMVRPASAAYVLMFNAAGIILALILFGVIRHFWIALFCFWFLAAFRDATEPLLQTWLNQQVDNPQVRATMFSVSSQVNSIGQISGAPVVGWIGNTFSIRAALVASACLLSPVLPLYHRVMRQGRHGSR